MDPTPLYLAEVLRLKKNTRSSKDGSNAIPYPVARVCSAKVHARHVRIQWKLGNDPVPTPPAAAIIKRCLVDNKTEKKLGKDLIGREHMF
mmetsp:Transcript_2585/g.5418  ORF Transcript_2585/g.5418 Transcript_2585/m.5418 type:complete len:90 (-) Transcript_2585:759-1028(-)